jgi:hypothetical protein
LAANTVVATIGVSLTRPHRLAAICYVIVLGLVAVAMWKRRFAEPKRTVAAGWSAMCVLVVLAVDRGLAFSDSVATRSRYRAVSSGWYEGRKPLQIVLMMVSIVAAALLVRGWWRLALAFSWSLLTGGVVGLIVLRMLRLVSLHQVDTVFELGAGPVTVFVVIELALLTAIAWGSLLIVGESRREELGCTSTAPMR